MDTHHIGAIDLTNYIFNECDVFAADECVNENLRNHIGGDEVPVLFARDICRHDRTLEPIFIVDNVRRH